MKKLMIYGATGYTGRMAAARAAATGTLVARPPGAIRQLDFGKGPVDCFQVTLPDLITRRSGEIAVLSAI